jgi:hypothetical protein
MLLEIPNAPQHLLFGDYGRGLQLVVEGADVLHPVRLMTNGAPEVTRVGAQLRALHGFNDLRLTGRLHLSKLQRDPLTPRLRYVLRVLDGGLAGASFQEIAKVVAPDDYIAGRWQGRARVLRDRIRRAMRRGYHLMNGGYRSLLS